MDANVEQRDGYRFVYVLPLGPRRLLVEDTYYSDTPELARGTLRERALAYATGFGAATVVREESGALPIVLGGDAAGYWRAQGGAPPVGVRALLFHHTTGYSLPEAVALADALAAAPQLATGPVMALVRERSLRRWREQRFFRLLNRLMFEAAEPDGRWRTLEHFYRMPEPLIARFYAGRLGAAASIRVLVGRPPVPVGRALRCIARSFAAERAGAAVARERRA
jgi:lycopene beta-cyclase